MEIKISGGVFSLPDIEIILSKRDLGNLVSEGKISTSLSYWEKPLENNICPDDGRRSQIINLKVVNDKDDLS